MADKSVKKPSVPKIHPAEPVVVMLLIVFVLSTVAVSFSDYFRSKSGLSYILQSIWAFVQGDIVFSDLINMAGGSSLALTLLVFRTVSLFVSILLIWGIISIVRKYNVQKNILKTPLLPPKEIKYGVFEPVERVVNSKWQKVLEHINSPTASDWKLGILEADIMLDEMLDKMGYHGATIGDKLKSIEPSDFSSLQDAWEAHKIRNSIAHEGSDFVINKPEAERVIKLFRKVFEEFRYI